MENIIRRIQQFNKIHQFLIAYAVVNANLCTNTTLQTEYFLFPRVQMGTMLEYSNNKKN